MTPDELRAAAQALYGDINDAAIKRRLSADLKVHQRTVGKWLYGERAIPGPAEVALGFMKVLIKIL